MGVGVAKVTEERCESHLVGNPLLRGVDQIAMIHQANLLRVQSAGYLNRSGSEFPMILMSANLQFPSSAVVGSTINVFVKEKEDDVLVVDARIAAGRTITAHGVVKGSIQFMEGFADEPIPSFVPGKNSYHGEDEVREILSSYGYGDSKQLIDGLFIEGDELAGFLYVPQERYYNYKSQGKIVFPQHEQVEALAQAHLLRAHLNGQIEEGMSPRLIAANMLFFGELSLPANIKAYVRVFGDNLKSEVFLNSGRFLFAGGFIEGTIIRADVGERLLSRARSQQLNPQNAPQFALQ